MADFRQCQESGCENYAELVCSCTPEKSYVCRDHFGMHFIKFESEDHQFEKILVPLEDVDSAELSRIQNTLSSLVRSKLQPVFDMKKTIEQSLYQNIQQIESDSSHIIKSFLTKEIEFRNQISSCRTKRVIPRLSSNELIALIAEKILNGESLASIDSQTIDKLLTPSLFFNPRNLIDESTTELRNLRYTHSKTEAENAKLKELQVKIEKMKTDLRNAATGNARLSKENKELKEQNAAWIQKDKDHQSKITDLQKEIERLNNDISKQKNEHDAETNTLNTKIRNQANHVQLIDKKNVENKRKIETLENQLRTQTNLELENRARNYESTINYQQKEIKRLMIEKKNLINGKKSSQEASAKKIRALQTENKKLRALQTENKKLHDQIDRRVQYIYSDDSF